jgi:hypothetical protein
MDKVIGVFVLVVAAGIVYEIVQGKNSVPLASNAGANIVSILGAPYVASYGS